jgi:Fic family protein
MSAEAAKMDHLIGTLLGTRDMVLTTSVAKARRAGNPYDPDRLELFQSLYQALRDTPPVMRLTSNRTQEGTATLAFFESYFSNFIEGTEFEVEEAANIVFRGVIPSARPQDAHDVLGTWRMVSSAHEMAQLPKRVEDLVRLLKHRHSAIMEPRSDKQPGQFKQVVNRAGATTFVAPELVEGTLKVGFEVYQGLEEPFQRAVFMMFMISEIHPFMDGNGRTARIMMNAELVAAGEERIVIPTIYRGNYLAALKAISQTNRPKVLIRALDYAQKWTASIDWTELRATQRQLEACNAFIDPATAEDMGKRLKMGMSL